MNEPVYLLMEDADETLHSSIDSPVRWVSDKAKALAWLKKPRRAVIVLQPNGTCGHLHRDGSTI